MIYKHDDYTLEIKSIMNNDDPTFEAWCFVYDDLKSCEKYEQQYSLNELVNEFEILKDYPFIFSRLVNVQAPRVDTQDGVQLSWNITKKDVIMLKIVDKNKSEILELKKENEILLKRLGISDKKLNGVIELFTCSIIFIFYLMYVTISTILKN